MNTIDALKKIVAAFLRMDESQVNFSTEINPKAIKGSVMLHRMYAVIARETGAEISRPQDIKTFGDLAAVCGGAKNVPVKAVLPPQSQGHAGLRVGIDMESVDKMPKVADCRTDTFYKQNFSPKEISYCVAQPDPWASFAGRFAAKEAIVKADNAYKGVAFAEIGIEVDTNGRPFFRDFAVSISHNGPWAIAVAMKNN